MASLAQTYAARGWVVLRGVLGAAALAELAAACEAIFPASFVGAMPRSDGVPHLVEPSRRHPAFAAWLATARPFEVAAACLGAARVQLLQDDLLYKRGGSDDVLAWHQDASYLGAVEPLRSASVRLALDEETIASGCMWVLDASHHGGLGLAQAGAARVADTRVHAPPGSDPIALELAPGDVTIHDAFTFHASHANTTDRPRRTLVVRVIDAACRLEHARLAPGFAPYFPVTATGQLDPRRFAVLPVGR